MRLVKKRYEKPAVSKIEVDGMLQAFRELHEAFIELGNAIMKQLRPFIEKVAPHLKDLNERSE